MTERSRNHTLSDEVLIALRRLIRAVDLHSRYLSKHFGLTGPQLVVLREMAELGNASPGELSAAVSLSQATVTGIIDRLEKRKLVVRKRDERDRRRVLLSPTPACLELLAKAPPPLQTSFLDRFNTLQDWEQAMLLSSLQRLVKLLDARDLDAIPVLASDPVGSEEHE